MIINTNSIILLYLLARSVLRNKDKQNFRAIKNKKQKKYCAKYDAIWRRMLNQGLSNS